MRKITILFLFLIIQFSIAGESSKNISNYEFPNIIIFYVDDLGWADTSVLMMNNEKESASDFNQTPSLERLASIGTKFSNAYSPAPTCTPSRKSIQLGKTPGRIQYTFVNDVLALKRNLTWGNFTSMADVVKSASTNYITAHFGKGMENEFMKVLGYDVTDEFDIGPNGNFHGEYDSIPGRNPLPKNDPKRIYSLTDTSVNFIDKHANNRPFYMMVSHYGVHVPHEASSELIEKYRNLPRGKYCTDKDYIDLSQMPEGFRITSWRLQYAAMLEEIDMSLGSIMDALTKHDILDNTYIIFTSDNGGGMNPNGPLRGCKANLYEGGIRVPFIVSGPSVLKNYQCDIPIAQWDLLPTLHDLSGSIDKLPSDLDGGSLRSVFENGNNGNISRPVEGFVFHYPCYFAPPLSVIRLGDFKYMRHIRTGEAKLFNLKNDYSEKNNLIDSMPEKAKELNDILNEYLIKIDAEDLNEVYQARYDQLDKFEAQSYNNYEKSISGLDPEKDIERINHFKNKLNNDIKRFAQNREEVKENMVNNNW